MPPVKFASVQQPQAVTYDAALNMTLPANEILQQAAKLLWNNRATLQSPSDGTVCVQTAAGAAGKLVVGSNTPTGGVGIARSGGTVVMVNGDGSATATVSAAGYQSNVQGSVAGNVSNPLMTATGPGLYIGSGTPSFSAPNGSLYLNYSGAAQGMRLYINTSGASSSGTTWTALTVL